MMDGRFDEAFGYGTFASSLGFYILHNMYDTVQYNPYVKVL